MAKKKMDIGLEYILSLGIKAARDSKNVFNILSEKVGEEKAMEVIEFIDKRYENESKACDSNDQDFYKFKNQDLNLSLAVTGCYDTNYIRKVCCWIDKNRDLFHGTILEVGCDTGIFSCFLAEQFPEANIVSIDLCEKSIENAKQLAKQRGIGNVEFRCCSIEDLHDQYDVVFSSKVAHETFSTFADLPYGTLLKEYGEFCKERLLPYANKLCSCLNEKGTLVSIERIGKNPLLLGWLLALDEKGLIVDEETAEVIEITELDKLSEFVFTVSHKGDSNEEEVYSLYGALITSEYAYNRNPVDGRIAELKLHSYKRNLLLGYNCYGIDKDTGKLFLAIKYAIWDTDTEDVVILEQASNVEGVYRIEMYSENSLEELSTELRQNAQMMADRGFTVWKLEYKDGKQIEAEEIQGNKNANKELLDKILNFDI